MAAPSYKLGLLRSLIRELRLANEKTPVQNTAQYTYLLEQFRSHQLTAAKVCKGHNQMEHMADTYRCLLESTRKHQALLKQYKGKGERSIEASANLVGLQLPKTFQKDPPL